MMKAHGIVLTRNDWGVFTVAIGHAFNHVDVIYELDHGSDDQTAHGLATLQSMWSDRLRVHSASPQVLFDESLLTNSVMAQAEAAGADWICVFDSDEFLLARPGKSLRETLAGVDSQVVALRYALRTCISPAGFDKLNLEHHLRWTLEGQTEEVCRNFQSAHLPLIGREILKRKSAYGAPHIKKGWPRTQGWQRQMIHQFDRQGRLAGSGLNTPSSMRWMNTWC